MRVLIGYRYQIVQVSAPNYPVMISSETSNALSAAREKEARSQPRGVRN